MTIDNKTKATYTAPCILMVQATLVRPLAGSYPPDREEDLIDEDGFIIELPELEEEDL